MNNKSDPTYCLALLATEQSGDYERTVPEQEQSNLGKIKELPSSLIFGRVAVCRGLQVQEGIGGLVEAGWRLEARTFMSKRIDTSHRLEILKRASKPHRQTTQVAGKQEYTIQLC